MRKPLKLYESISSGDEPSMKQLKLKLERVKELQAQVEYHQYIYYNAQPEIRNA